MQPAHRALVIAALAGVAVSAGAAARAQIAVTTVPGDGSRCDGLCYDAIVEAIEGQDLEAVQAPAGSRRSPGRRLARSGAEMLLVADVVGPAGRRAVRLRGYLADGSCFFDETERTRGGRHAARVVRGMVADLLEGAGAAALEETGEEEEPERERRRGRRVAERREEERGPRGRTEDDERPVPTFGSDPGGEEEGGGDVRARARVDRGRGRNPFLYLHAGIDLTARTMEMPLAGEEATRQYVGGAYPGFEVAGTAFPAAPLVPGWPGNIGLHARYGRHIALTSHWEGQALETHQDQVDVLAVYRWPLLGRRDGIALTGGLGYMRVAFQVPERGALDDFVYQALAIGLELEAPLPWAGLALRAGGRYGMVLGMGEVGRAYAQAATVHGWEAALELSGTIVAGLRYVFAFEVFGFESQFVGAGDLGQAVEAHDHFFRGRAGLAYQFSTGG